MEGITSIDDKLIEIIERANECIDDELVFFEPDYDDKGDWKLAFLVGIGVKFLLMVLGSIHEAIVTRDKAGIEAKYKNLPKLVIEMISIEKVEESRKYNLGGIYISILFYILTFIFEFCVIYFDIPAYIWYGWIDVLRNDGHCKLMVANNETDAAMAADGTHTYGIYM